MGKKILLVTGKLSEKYVRKYAAESGIELEVKVMPVSVATFMTGDLLINKLKDVNTDDFSMILVPGMTSFDLRRIENKVNLPTFKGPKYAADIPLVLNNLKKIKLSKIKPAFELLKIEAAVSAEKQLEEIENIDWSMLSETKFKIGKGKSSIAIAKELPVRIIAEIADAPLLPNDEIIKIVDWYLKSGAEIIDIGMVAGKKMPKEISRIISTIRNKFDVPLSIDTLNVEEIQASLDAGIDLILSIQSGTIDSFPNLEVPAVLIPTEPENGSWQKNPYEKVKLLAKIAGKARDLGYKKIITDPVLEPVNQGFLSSLVAFYELRRLEPNLPILMGVGNAIELYDADSVGMSALVMGAASEINASFVLTVEASDKTRGNVAELRKAREMIGLARSRNSVPKDLGIDLLRLKEKRRYSDAYDREIENIADVFRARKITEFKLDAKRVFRIFVDGSEIIAVLFAGNAPKSIIKGKRADEICQEIIRRGLIDEVSHAAYIGRELQKAEISVKTKRGYSQGKEIF